jgi:hypothetical protein
MAETEHIYFSGSMLQHRILHLLRLNASSLCELELVDIEVNLGFGSHVRTLFETIRSIVTLKRLRILNPFGRRMVECKDAYFAAQCGAKSEAHQAVEDFLAQEVERIPPHDEWDFIRMAKPVLTSGDSWESSNGLEVERKIFPK